MVLTCRKGSGKGEPQNRRISNLEGWNRFTLSYFKTKAHEHHDSIPVPNHWDYGLSQFRDSVLD